MRVPKRAILALMPRPSKLTPEVQEKIIVAIASGNWQETACKYAGIGVNTFYTWMSKGEGAKAKDPYKGFREAVERARSQAEIRNVALIQQAGQEGSWQAAAWYLERSYPMRWGKQGRLEVTGSDGGAVKVDVSVDELERKVANLFDKI